MNKKFTLLVLVLLITLWSEKNTKNTYFSDKTITEDTIIIIKDSSLFDTFLSSIAKEIGTNRTVIVQAKDNALKEIILEIATLPAKTVIAVDANVLSLSLKHLKNKSILALNVLNLDSYKGNPNLLGIKAEIPMEQIITTFKYNVLDRNSYIYFAPKERKTEFEVINKNIKVMGIDVKTIYVSSPDDVIDYLSRIKGEEVLIMFPDLNVLNDESLTAMIDHTLEYRVPFIGYDHRFVDYGCLFALQPDLIAAVSQVKGMIIELEGGKKPTDIGLQFCIGTKMIFNLKTAKNNKMEYAEIVDSMDEVIK